MFHIGSKVRILSGRFQGEVGQVVGAFRNELVVQLPDNLRLSLPLDHLQPEHLQPEAEEDATQDEVQVQLPEGTILQVQGLAVRAALAVVTGSPQTISQLSQVLGQSLPQCELSKASGPPPSQPSTAAIHIAQDLLRMFLGVRHHQLDALQSVERALDSDDAWKFYGQHDAVLRFTDHEQQLYETCLECLIDYIGGGDHDADD